MKKRISIRLFYFFLGMIICSSIGVVAYSLQAKDIGFTPNNNNWKVDNINDAINDLYEESLNNNIYNCISGTFDASLCLTNGSCLIEDKIRPSLFVIRNYTTGQIHAYDERTSSTYYVSFSGSGYTKGLVSQYYEITTNGLYSKITDKNWATGQNGYVVCEFK